MTKPQSMIAAFFCTFIWGTTFIAQDTGMELIGPYVFNTTRFFVGFLALIPFYLFLEKKTTREVLSKNRKRFIYLSISTFLPQTIVYPLSSANAFMYGYRPK